MNRDELYLATNKELIEEVIELVIFLLRGIKMPLSRDVPKNSNPKIPKALCLLDNTEKEILRRMRDEDSSIEKGEGAEVCCDSIQSE